MITNQHFTKQAIEDARILQVQLWDRSTLKKFIRPHATDQIGVGNYGRYDLLPEFVNIRGSLYNLNQAVTNIPIQMELFDRKYAQKAKWMMEKTNKSVFYCLKMVEHGSYRQGNYFLILIEEEEKETIIKRYADRFYIGIIHRPHKS